MTAAAVQPSRGRSTLTPLVVDVALPLAAGAVTVVAIAVAAVVSGALSVEGLTALVEKEIES